MLFSLKHDVVAEAGGQDGVKLKMLPCLRHAGDGDTGICFECAAPDAVRRHEPRVVERVYDALALCTVPNQEVGSILFGAEEQASQQLIDTAAALLTEESRLLSGYRGQPVKLRRHLSPAAAAFRRKGVGSCLLGCATLREDCHVPVPCGRGEGGVEGRERGLVVDSDVQYAAVGQFEAGACP